MGVRGVRREPEILLRAARLARLPGVRRAEACERFGLSKTELREAIRSYLVESIPSRRDIVLHAITDAGNNSSGPLPDFRALASYVDYINKDGSTPEQIMEIVDAVVAEGILLRTKTTWRLLVEFP